MIKKITIVLLLCLSLALTFGSAMAGMDDNTSQDTSSADTPSNGSTDNTDEMDYGVADGNKTEDVTGDNETEDVTGDNETEDVTGDNETEDVAGDNETEDVAGDNETEDVAGDNETEDVAGDNVTDELADDIFSDGEEGDDETDDISPFEGAVGPEHALYGLKIAFGNINETFTYNSSERLGLQVSRARHRIAEARAEIKKGNDDGAAIALGHYKKTMDNIGVTVNGSDVNDTDLVKANGKMSKHQNALQYMVQQKKAQGKNVEGLTDALNGSLMVQMKFSHKLEKPQKGSMKDQVDALNTSINKSKGGKPDNQKGSNGRNTR
ncbi:MAG: DUF5667 domain-containing protein [ANME-2 cluster archaeon]|nr:DUF5667 domain-containing protein [ANME-2 cluster archaeon]